MNNEEKIQSDMQWDFVFEVLQFFMNDIEPSDLRDYSPSGNIREYFKNKYKLIKRKKND